MNKIRAAIYTALRDDSVATVGLRALLGHATNPYGVYFQHFPEEPDFTSQSYLVYKFLGGPAADDHHGVDVDTKQNVLAVIVWSRSADAVNNILKRVNNILRDMRKVTIPTSEEELHGIKNAGPGPDLWDSEFKAHGRQDSYTIWYREDHTN